MRLFGVATLLAVMLLSLSAQDTSAQFRYRVQAGESLQSIASKFGVEAEAIRRSSFMPDPNNLVAGQVIVIPYAWQTPEEAALMASEREGTSPFTAGVHWVEAGDSIWYIADLYGVDRFELAAFNGLSADAALAVGDRILLPGDASVSVSTNVATAGETTNSLSDAISAGYVAELSAQGFAWVPQYKQQRNLSCEYAAAYIATSAFGSPIHESVFLDWVPQTQNPHYGYRGNIDGIWGGYDDYGVYASALVPALNAHGYAGEVFYGGYSASQLTTHLDAGHPVLVWLSMWGDPGIVYEDEGRYTVFAGMHVVTAFAYDSAGVYVSDPGAGAYRHFDWDTFMNMWGLVDGMALAVYPY
jgi:uncharacterized protein YvpB/LysM repeat protein